MSSVKALPVGHVSPMYVVMESSHGLKKNNAHWTAHEAGAQQYKRPPPHPQLPGGSSHHNSPPLTGTRGCPYPQEPLRNTSSSSNTAPSNYTSTNSTPHMPPHHHPVGGAGGANSIYNANHMYRDSHFQVDSRQQPQQPEVHSLERYAEQQQQHHHHHQQQHVRRRLSLRPTPEYVAGIERERYMEAIRYQYERDVALGTPFANAAVPRGVKPLVVSVHTPSELDMGQPGKRPRLAVEPKAPVHQPLVIDTRNIVIKKEPAYTPQVEAISPTLPSEEGRCDSPMKVLKENILGNINRLDKEINQVESQVTKLQKKLHELEVEASKPAVMREAVKDISHIESKQMSIAQIIYSENRAKALESHAILEKLGQKVEIPMYNQPSDTVVYHENKRKFIAFKCRLTNFFKKRHRERELRENHLTDTYSKLMQEWLKKMEKKENNTAKKAKDAKLREFFEKQFPELKKQREDKERITRVSQRIRSDAEWEEIIDGLQEQELEEKKMRSYAVIPPIRLDSRQRQLWYINHNGLIEDLSHEYKEKQMLNIWTDQEKEIFREKYLQHPKNFSLIASCLDRKTVADCVQYYYLTKKSENYKQLLRKHSVRKRTRALVKPQHAQQPQNAQSSGITTRQQEEAKSTAVNLSTASVPVTSSENIVTTATPNDATTLNHVATSSSVPSNLHGIATASSAASASLSPTLSASSVVSPTTSLVKKMDIKITDASNDKEKIHLPNNIRKKKEASKKAEGAEKGGGGSDSDTASDHQNENGPVQPCAICKIEIDNVSQSRALTKSNCSMFGIKDTELVADMRVCASCRFKSVRRRCPIPTCKTPKRKVKRLRPLPTKLAELPKDAKDSIVSEFQIPPDVTKCCSACFNRITRKLESSNMPENEPAENSRWNEEETDAFKKGLKQFGTDWDAIAGLVVTKNNEQCRNFYFNYKRKLGLEELLKGKKAEGGKDGEQQEDKPPPIVTDEEESGETTSSCEEDNCVDRCSSDTASAPSPAEKILEEVKTEDPRPPAFLPIATSTTLTNNTDQRVQSLQPHIDSSPKGQADYDSSATVSADEGQNQNDNEIREASPVNPPSSLHISKIPMQNDKLVKASYNPPILKEIECRSAETGVPLVKTLLQDPNIGAGHSEVIRPSYLDQPPNKGNKEEPTCVRDLIYQAIEMSLQWPAKPGRNNSPIPAGINKEAPDVVHLDTKKEFIESSGVPVPPTAHCGSRRPSRPGSKHSDSSVVDCEVQDLSKKSRSKDSSPPREYVKRERIVPPARPPSESSSTTNHGHYYGAPPPAHCNQYRSSQPPPALSPHYVSEPHHDPYYARGTEPRSKVYTLTDRPHSQPPHLVAQASATLASTPPLQSHQKPIVAKATTVPPPPPLIASKPSQLSPKLSYKERLVTIPPAGSITQGTPVNQQPLSGATNLAPTRYEGFLRQLPPPQTKDGGSITLGTPVQHEQQRRIPAGRGEVSVPTHISPAVYDPAVVEYFRHVAPSGQPYPFVPAYPGSAIPPRPPYANESQLSSKQIMIDFNTSKQMQLRRGITGDKDIKVSPRGSESSPAPSDTHLHPMYPPVNYQGTAGPPFGNQLPANYQQATDSRFSLHRTQIDRNQSPSGNESPVNVCFPHPGKRSPGLAQGASRQNVIHRSITWGTAKPSVIQAPQSSSPRTGDSHSEPLSPAMIRKSTPSPRNPQQLIYQHVPPSGHDAFNTLVNAAVAQPSLIVPKDGKGSPAARQETKSPRDRPVVEGLEKTLIDMHQRPRSFTETGIRNSSHTSHSDHGRNASEHTSSESQRQVLGVTADGHRYLSAVPHPSYDISRESPRHLDRQQVLVNEHSPTSIRLGNMREPFSREQFERQMRQPESSRERDRLPNEKEHERGKSEHSQNYSGHSQQSDLDNEASKIFSQSFQKDAPRTGSSPRGFTAANLIDAIITRQINQNVETPVVTKGNSSADLFNQYHSPYEGQKQRLPASKLTSRAEVVTIDDEPESEKCVPNWNDRQGSHGRSPPVPITAASSGMPVVPIPYATDKVVTLGEHIAAIISKDYNSPSDGHPTQPFFNNSNQAPGSTNLPNNATSRNSPYIPGAPHPAGGKQLEGIAAALPTEGILSNSRDMPDHSPQNCPGNGCVYHTHSWKLRRALQQDKDREHRSPASVEGSHSRPISAQAAGSPIGQDERQIIRVSQTASPSVQPTIRTSPVTPYAVEPISPPGQTESPTSVESNSNRSRPLTKAVNPDLTHSQTTTWTSNPSITGLLTTRQIYPQEYSDGLSPPASLYSGAPVATQPNGCASNRPPHQQQQMGLSPLDYVKNRIVEVMRTASDDSPDAHESRRLQPSHSDEREHQAQHAYKFQMVPDRDPTSERPCSTGSGIPQMPSQRYSPAVSRYSPIPPRPSSAAERVPSRNSTPGEIQRHHKRNMDVHHITSEWHDNHSGSSKTISRPISPSSQDPKDPIPRKKMRSDSTFIPESTVDHAPVLLPENPASVSRVPSHGEAPRLSLNSHGSQVLDNHSSKNIVSNNLVTSQSDSFHPSSHSVVNSQDFRNLNMTRPENPWEVVTVLDRPSTDNRLPSSNANTTLSASVEAISPPARESVCATKNLDTGSRSEVNSSMTGSSLGLSEPSRSSPGTPQRNASSLSHNIGAASNNSGHYTAYSASSGSGVSNSSTFSSTACLQPPANQHLGYSSFSGVNTTYAYPYSALTMRSLVAANTTPVTNSSVAGTTHVSPIPVSNSSTSARNSPSPLSRNNQPPPLLSSQYEPLSDED